jgi:RNA polymerase sigma factor (sigma-70 family)
MDTLIASIWEAAPEGTAHVSLGRDTTGHACRAILRASLTSNYDRLHRRLMRYLGCAEQASDSLHDAWMHLGEMALPGAVNNPESYVYRVACNLAIDRLRKERGMVSLDDLRLEMVPADPRPGPEQVAQAKSELKALDRVINGLPHRHREVLLGLRLDERSRADVASALSLSLRRVDAMLRESVDRCLMGIR